MHAHSSPNTQLSQEQRLYAVRLKDAYVTNPPFDLREQLLKITGLEEVQSLKSTNIILINVAEAVVEEIRSQLSEYCVIETAAVHEPERRPLNVRLLL